MHVHLRPGSVAAIAVLLLVSAARAQAQVFEVIDAFAGCPADGCGPGADVAHPSPSRPLLLGPDGKFYGLSLMDWREGEEAPRTWGTVYRMTSSGAREILHNFDGTSAGGIGASHLALGADGVLYGLGSLPGLTRMFFRLDGAFEILVEFSGFEPYDLVATPNGAIYITGTGSFPFPHCEMFRWDGTLTLVGDICATGLHAAADGNHYFPRTGCHPLFGASNGSVARLTADERIETVYEFASHTGPVTSDLVIGSDGNVYGTAAQYLDGCTPWALGIYRLTPAGSFTYLPNSRFLRPLGSGPDGSVFVDGGFGSDTVSWLRPDGTLTPLHTFTDAADTGLVSALTRGSDGHLYGIRSAGGDHGLGVFFRIRLPTADMKANGADGPIEVGAGDPLTISMAFDASATELVSPAEVYLAVVTPALQVIWTTPGGFSVTPAPLYSGPLPSFPSTPVITIPDAAVLPAGDYYWVAIVDADANGVPNGHYVDFVKTTRAASALATRRR